MIGMQETRTYTAKGQQTVADAYSLMSKLPNGWRLEDFRYMSGTWVATVTAAVKDLDE